jgi:hypothetical protein
MSNHGRWKKGKLLKNCSTGNRINVYAVLSVVIPFLFYLLTLAPSVTFFDSGEFLTAIQSLGSPHSPGYPLFVLYAKPFTWLPFGNIAFRVNIATAVSAAAACYGIYLLVSFMLTDDGNEETGKFDLFLNNAAALGASLAFAFSSRLWLQSNHDKPYPLLAFFSAMILYLILVWRSKYRSGWASPGYLYLGAFLCGLSFGAHQSMVLLMPSYIWLILSADWTLIKRIKEQIVSCTFFLAGFSVYLYLPIRATRHPLLNWGDPETLDNFLWHFLRKGYPAEKVDRDFSLLWKQLSAFNLVHEFTIVGLFLLLTGLFMYAVKRRDEVIAYAIAVCTFLAVLVGYQNTPEQMIFLTEEFFTPVYLFTAVFIGLGLCFLVRKAVHGAGRGRLAGYAVRLVAGVVFLSLPATLCAINYHENDQHENYIAFDYATNTLRSLDQDAVLYTWGDSGAFPLWYLQGVEKMREDLVLLHTPHLVFKWYLDSFPGFFDTSALRNLPPDLQSPYNVLHLSIAEQIDRRPVYIDFSTKYSVNLDVYSLIQKGICYRVEKNEGNVAIVPDQRIWKNYNSRGLVGEKIPFRDLDTEKAIMIFAISHMDAGKDLLSLGMVSEGFAELDTAEKIMPDLAWQVRQAETEYRNK